LVIFATTLYVPAAGKVYVMFGPDPMAVPRWLPPAWNQRQLIVHGGAVARAREGERDRLPEHGCRRRERELGGRERRCAPRGGEDRDQ
jgi:hypothetical protein